MIRLTAAIVACLNHFAPLYSRRTWRHVLSPMFGALLTPGQRMVNSALRAVGLAQTPTFQAYHCVFNRAVWSNLGISRILLRLPVAAVVDDDWHGALLLQCWYSLSTSRDAGQTCSCDGHGRRKSLGCALH